MGTEPATKTCKLCCMDIPANARKCPHCHQFQNRLSLAMFHPAVAVLFATIPMAAMLVFFATLFESGEDFQTYQSQIQVTESELAFGDTMNSQLRRSPAAIGEASRYEAADLRRRVSTLITK